MARSDIEMQRKWNRDGALNRYLFIPKHFQTQTAAGPLSWIRLPFVLYRMLLFCSA